MDICYFYLMSIEKQLLTEPLEIHFDPQFCKQSRQMGFKNIQEITEMSAQQLIGMEGFSFSWLGTLSQFLHEKGLISLLQPLPGSRRV